MLKYTANIKDKKCKVLAARAKFLEILSPLRMSTYVYLPGLPKTFPRGIALGFRPNSIFHIRLSLNKHN